MAYKPKYAQGGSPKKNTVIREPVQQPRQPQKMKKGVLILFIVLGLVVVPVSSWLTVRLLGGIYENVGRPKQAAQAKSADMQILENFEDTVSARISAVRNSMRPADLEELPEELRPTEETLPPIRKQYWLEEDTLVAPEPDQSKFGSTTDPEELAQVLHDARWLLDGQTTYFQPDQKLYEESTVRYYLDDSIFAITWQEVHDGSVYTYSEVKVSHPSQFRRHLSGEEFGSGMLSLTSEMAQSVHAVVGCSGDYYSYRRRGLTIVDGQVKKYVPGLPDTCYVNADGDLILERDQDFADVDAVQVYVDENDIQFSLSFGPILVKDGENVCPNGYDLGEVKQRYSRAAICQMDKLHYLYIAAGMDVDTYGLMTMRTFSKHVAETGCRQAYALDGGQTTTIVLNNEVINHVNYGSERRISDIIYFATAIPEGE